MIVTVKSMLFKYGKTPFEYLMNFELNECLTKQ